LANLRVGDVMSDQVVVRNGKGGKNRVVPLIPSLAGRLQGAR
jgi:integrase